MVVFFLVGLTRSPVVSFVYERGWRQNFARAGFPGADEEVSFHLQPTIQLQH
jgi:hypothetical protein